MQILVTGADGVIGREVVEQLLRHPAAPTVVPVVRGRARPGAVTWHLGETPPPPEIQVPWDSIVHLAASTRWTMNRAEAEAANIAPTRAVVDLVRPGTHLVQVSTAYVGGVRDADSVAEVDFDGYRNGYEWSKARCEEVVREAVPSGLTVVRPPLVLGRETDGAIARFSGPYTLLQSLVSGLAAVVVGSPEGYAEIAPVDLVARTVVEAALAPAPSDHHLHVISAGAGSLRLADLIRLTCETLNEWRGARDLDPIGIPPMISTDSWHRFFLPLAERHLSPVQSQAVQLLGMFEAYTSMPEPFEPTHRVADPADVLVRSVRWWADTKPRAAARVPTPWTLIGSST